MECDGGSARLLEQGRREIAADLHVRRGRRGGVVGDGPGLARLVLAVLGDGRRLVGTQDAEAAAWSFTAVAKVSTVDRIRASSLVAEIST